MRVKLLLDGNRMAVTPLSPDITGRLEQELSYVRKIFLQGEEARYADKHIRFEPIDCYRYAGGRLITNAGFLQRVKRVLQELKHTPAVKDLTPHSEPEKLRVHRNRLKPEELRYRQLEALETLAKFRRARIDCPTAYGKSYLYRWAVEFWHDAKIDIIAPGADTARDLYEALGEERGGVGLFGAGTTKKGRRIQIYCVNSLHRSEFDADIVLADEVHEYATDKRLEQLARYEKARMYATSASHDSRDDGADFELEALFGPIVMSIPYQEAVDAKIITPIRVRWVPVVMDEDPCADDKGVVKERWGIWRNKYRNQVIRDVAREYPDDQVLITVKTVDHMVHLKKLLPEFEMVHAENAMSPDDRQKYVSWGLIDKDEPVMTRPRRDSLKRLFEQGKLRKVIANSVWNRGVNFHQLSVLIRADAARSRIAATQIPGRLSRLYEGKEYGLLIDLMDQFNRGFRDRAKFREKDYGEKKWVQEYPQAKSRFLQSRMFT